MGIGLLVGLVTGGGGEKRRGFCGIFFKAGGGIAPSRGAPSLSRVLRGVDFPEAVLSVWCEDFFPRWFCSGVLMLCVPQYR